MADVIEGAFHSGAEVVFWTPPDAPIRAVLQRRSVTPTYRDWPPCEAHVPQIARDYDGGPDATKVLGGVPLLSRLWRAVTPFPVRRLIGFHIAIRRFGRDLRS